MEFGTLKEKKRDGSYETHLLNKPVVTLGRSKTADIIIPDSSVSRIHVRFECSQGVYKIVDNNSSNGTYVNKKKIVESTLADGDDVVIGRVQFFFKQALEGDTTGEMQKETIETPRRDLAQTAAFSPVSGGDYDTPPSPHNVSQPPPQMPPSPPSFGGAPSSSPPPPISSQPQAPPAPPSFAQAPPTQAPPQPPSFGQSPPPAGQPMPTPPSFGAPSPPAFGGQPGEMTSAPPVTRFLAVLIDYAIVFVAMVIGTVLAIFLPGILGTLISLALSVGAIVYYLGGWIKYGKTLGKHLMGLQIIDVDHPAQIGIPPKGAILRMLGLCVLGWILIFFDPEGRGLHDKWGNTMVIKK